MWLYVCLITCLVTAFLPIVIRLLANSLRPKVSKACIWVSILIDAAAAFVIVYKCVEYNWLDDKWIFKHWLSFNQKWYFIGITFDGMSAILLLAFTYFSLVRLYNVRNADISSYYKMSLKNFLFTLLIFAMNFRVLQH